MRLVTLTRSLVTFTNLSSWRNMSLAPWIGTNTDYSFLKTSYALFESLQRNPAA